jgi:N-acetylglutamate synthase-like GNAT family acetyltransferase
MAVHYRDSKDVDLFQLAKLFAESGVGEAASDLARLGEIVRGSTRIVWAMEHHKVIGFASAISDGALTGFVSHVVVQADSQGRGVEEALVDRLVKGQPGVTFVMRGTAATARFCAALGFKATDGLCFTRQSQK